MEELKGYLIHKIKHVEEFHEVFKIGNRHEPTGELSENEYILRYNLLKEENDEYLKPAKMATLLK